MSHSIQFHCLCFHFSTVSKRETVYTIIWKEYMFQVISSLLPVSNLIFGKNSQKFAKIDLNRIIRQRICGFFKIRIFRIDISRDGLWSDSFWSRFPNINTNKFVPVTPNVQPICDICDGHKLSQIWICDRLCFSGFFLVCLAKQVWSHFGHKCHNRRGKF